MLANRAALKRTVVQENLSPPPMPSADQLYAAMDKSSPGLELARLQLDQSKSSPPTQEVKNAPKNSLVSHKNLPLDSDKKSKNVESRMAEDQWTEVADQMTKQKSEVLAQEHFENMWSKGRDYKKKEYHSIPSGVHSNNFIRAPTSVSPTIAARSLNQGGMTSQQERKFHSIYEESESSDNSEEAEDENENAESENGNESEKSSVMGLDTPGIRVWESKSKHRGNIAVASSPIHHPLESSEVQKKKRTKRNQSKKLRKRSRACAPNLWQEPGRGSFLLGDGQDTQNPPHRDSSFGEEYFDYAEAENGFGRGFSGMVASCSLSSFMSSVSSYSSSSSYSANNVLTDTFIKLKSEVSYHTNFVYRVHYKHLGVFFYFCILLLFKFFFHMRTSRRG
jgi:sorting nexin-13